MDSKVETRLRVTLDEDLSKKLGKKDPQPDVDSFVESAVVKVDEGKFKCDVCAKLFKGTDFVTKHMRTKHEDKIQQIENDVAFLNNYIQDPNHVLPTPPPAPAATANPALFGNNPNQFARPIPTFPMASLPIRPPMRPFVVQPPQVRPFQPFDPAQAASFGNPPQFQNYPAQGFRPRGGMSSRGGRPLVSRITVAENDPRALRNYSDLDDIPDTSTLLDYRSDGLSV